MAKRGRAVSLDGLMAELKSLDVRRREVAARIQSAVAEIMGSGGNGVPSPARRGRPAVAAKAAKGTRKRKPMSAAARKAVGARMKKYWAARRKAKGAAK